MATTQTINNIPQNTSFYVERVGVENRSSLRTTARTNGQKKNQSTLANEFTFDSTCVDDLQGHWPVVHAEMAVCEGDSVVVALWDESTADRLLGETMERIGKQFPESYEFSIHEACWDELDRMIESARQAQDPLGFELALKAYETEAQCLFQEHCERVGDQPIADLETWFESLTQLR